MCSCLSEVYKISLSTGWDMAPGFGIDRIYIVVKKTKQKNFCLARKFNIVTVHGKQPEENKTNQVSIVEI